MLELCSISHISEYNEAYSLLKLLPVFLFSQPRPIGIHVLKEDEDTGTFYQRAFSDWEAEGLFSPLETDLMYMSKPLKESKKEGV